MLSTLNYKDSKGKDRVWSIRVVKDDSGVHIETTTGQVGGKMRIINRKVSQGKRKRDLGEKAADEARSKWTTKNQEIERKKKYKVMLAHKFLDHEKNIKYPVFVQPKLDGCRALAYRKDDKIFLISRNGLEKRNPLNHIKEALLNMLSPNGTDYIDGELYTHGLARGKLTGICNKKTITNDYKTRSLKVQYHMFDLVDCNDMNESIEKRYNRLMTSYQKIITPTPNIIQLVQMKTAKTREDVIKSHNQWVSEGYEGVMIRIPGSIYENKRSKMLLKYKEFEDDEFEICGFHEGKGDWEGTPIWECWLDKDANLKFSAKQRGTIEELKKLFTDANKYIGKQLTVRFQSRMDNGCPEFGVGIELDRKDI